MFLFRSLATIGITREELSGNLALDVIRIEKKLLAQNRLNNTPSKNDIDLIVKALKDYPDVIREISSYECLYGILADVDARFIDRIRSYSPEQAARIRYVVSNYFKDELTVFINESINAGDWNKLSILVIFKLFLSTDILQSIIQKLTGKLAYALVLLEKHPSSIEIRSKAEFLSEESFFRLLGELDARHFRGYVLLLLIFIGKNRIYARTNPFFNGMVHAMCSFKPVDNVIASNLTAALHLTTIVKPKDDKKVAAFFLGIVGFFIIILIIAKWKPDTAKQRINYLENQKLEYGSLENAAYWKEDQKIKMEDFIEARLYPVFYPPNSRNLFNKAAYKYHNPFTTEIFENQYFPIKHEGIPHINIINRTLKECVVIAYFDYVYDEDRKGYILKSDESRHILYALYIPPADSIQIDYKMYLLRFYMGHDLRNFNTYRGYVYPDSTDAKFARYSKADSMLFSRAFVFSPENESNIKQDLTITQPSENSYFLSWTGAKPLHQYGNWTQEVISRKLNDTVEHESHTLLLDLKTAYKNQTEEDKQPINAFMNY